MHGQESRVIHYALLASIVLHALLLSFSTSAESLRLSCAGLTRASIALE